MKLRLTADFVVIMLCISRPEPLARRDRSRPETPASGVTQKWVNFKPLNDRPLGRWIRRSKYYGFLLRPFYPTPMLLRLPACQHSTGAVHSGCRTAGRTSREDRWRTYPACLPAHIRLVY